MQVILILTAVIIAVGGLDLVNWNLNRWWTGRTLILAAPAVVAWWALGTSSPPEPAGSS